MNRIVNRSFVCLPCVYTKYFTNSSLFRGTPRHFDLRYLSFTFIDNTRRNHHECSERRPFVDEHFSCKRIHHTWILSVSSPFKRSLRNAFAMFFSIILYIISKLFVHCVPIVMGSVSHSSSAAIRAKSSVSSATSSLPAATSHWGHSHGRYIGASVTGSKFHNDITVVVIIINNMCEETTLSAALSYSLPVALQHWKFHEENSSFITVM